ncbi:hypothetical protein TraAM80_10414, partial [Trypanosoma rangeli]
HTAKPVELIPRNHEPEKIGVDCGVLRKPESKHFSLLDAPFCLDWRRTAVCCGGCALHGRRHAPEVHWVYGEAFRGVGSFCGKVFLWEMIEVRCADGAPINTHG